MKGTKEAMTKKKPKSIEDAPFFKKKMKKGARMLAVAGLPDIGQLRTKRKN